MFKRNDRCYCGSQIKYKKCHLYIEQGYEKIDTNWKIKDKKTEQFAKKVYDTQTKKTS